VESKEVDNIQLVQGATRLNLLISNVAQNTDIFTVNIKNATAFDFKAVVPSMFFPSTGQSSLNVVGTAQTKFVGSARRGLFIASMTTSTISSISTKTARFKTEIKSVVPSHGRMMRVDGEKESPFSLSIQVEPLGKFPDVVWSATNEDFSGTVVATL
jgi:hypothetical protein